MNHLTTEDKAELTALKRRLGYCLLSYRAFARLVGKGESSITAIMTGQVNLTDSNRILFNRVLDELEAKIEEGK